ncbi:MAG: histidinol-phosphate transaminase [Deltaproteobacteria bacterium]|nr:MAG: histidinol-phosphate transaminase [Deltaproteobacteria bacterium]
MADPFDDLVPPYIQSLRPYQPGKPVDELERELGIDGAIKIASNENPLGPSPKAVDAARAAVADCHLYPDGGAWKLRRALAERLGVGHDEIVFGAGSNEIIGMIVKAFCRPGADEVLAHRYAFLSYRLFSQMHGVDFVEADVHDDLRCDVDALIDRMSARTRVIFLANPNNPTGAYVPRPEFERILEAAPPRALVVVDEAYHEYAVALADDYPRSQDYRADRPLLVTLRTFSKIYGLAGLRIGYAVCAPRVANYLERVRRPFNAASVAQAAALAALDDDAHVDRSRAHNAAAIDGLRAAVEELGLRAYPSVANFVLAGVGRDAAPVYDALLRRGVIVRPMAAWGLPHHLRISAAGAGDTARVAAALRDVLAA